MGFLVPLVVSVLVIAGGGGRWLADAATTTAAKSETPAAHWEALLPGVQMPPAISVLLAQRNVLHSLDGVASRADNLKFVKGLRKIGPNYQISVKSEPDHGGKHVQIASEAEDHLKEISTSYGSRAHGQEMEESLKEISVSYGLVGDERDPKKVLANLKKILEAYRTQKQENLKEISVSYGSKGGEDLKEISVSYGSEGEKDLKEISVSYGSQGGKDLKEISVSYGSEGEKDLKEISVSYGVEGGEGVNETFLSYGIEQTKNPKEVVSHGTTQENLKEISVSYGSDKGKDEHNKVFNKGEEDPHKLTTSYGSKQEEDPHKVTMSYGSEQEDDPHKVTVSYGSEQEEDPHKATMSYGSEQEEDPHKATMSYGSEQEEDPHKATMSYGSEQEEDPHKATMSYGSEQEEDPHKATMSYGSAHEENPKPISTRETHTNAMGDGTHHHHVHAHNQNSRRQQADVFFFQDTLRLGSIITPTIPPTTSLPRLLPRHVADSIPFSTERLTDIVTMFAPASLSMTREIRWTLDTCQHPGKNAGCTTSLESLAELPVSLLGTRNVHAFSAADLPVEAPGTPALRGRYNVTAVRTISGESSEVVTCHDLTYPYAVYFCHTSTPTAAYAVTLASVEEDVLGVAPAAMEVLAVCHLDTSRWSSKNPFFELHNLKPGEVAVCHFLTKLSIIWVPGGDAHTMVR